MLKQKFVDYLESYADYHRHPTNKLCHWIGIPLVAFHVVSMLDWVKLFTVGSTQVTLLMVLFPIIVGWYLTLDVATAVVTGTWYMLFGLLGRHVSAPIVITVAVIGWTIQLLGHAIWEKRSPAFLSNLLQALVGPMYLCAQTLGAWKPKKTELEK